MACPGRPWSFISGKNAARAIGRGSLAAKQGAMRVQPKQFPVSGKKVAKRFYTTGQPVRRPRPFSTVREFDFAGAIEKRFLALAILWKLGVGTTSSPEEIVAHPAYLQIIALGRPAVPLILRDLVENGPDFWFAALQAIVDKNPVPDDVIGDLPKMAACWIDWGRRHGEIR
jgi:hypothetical protein